jgi:hypothetical protein
VIQNVDTGGPRVDKTIKPDAHGRKQGIQEWVFEKSSVHIPQAVKGLRIFLHEVLVREKMQKKGRGM